MDKFKSNIPGTPIGFGATNNAAASPFGTSKPFGGTTQPGTGGLFGGGNSSNTTAGGTGFGFGATNNTSNVFGGGNTAAAGGSGLFGNSKPAFGPTTTTAGATGGLFGTANSGTGGVFGGGANTGIGFSSGAAQGPLTGTANPPYTAFTEKEAQGGTTNHFQTIAFMPAYKNWSLEELRLQDYVQGRRYGTDSGNSGAFGQGTQFGAAFGATSGNNTSGFGPTNNSATTGGGLFGGAANNNTTSTPFGATNTGGGFGTGATQTGGGGLFGVSKPATGGLFGAPSNTTTTGGSGLFGAGANNTTTGAFGGGNTTGTFGATGATGATGGLFGAANNNNNQQAQKPFSFGNTGTGFGGGASNTAFNAQGNNATATGGGLFGNAQSTAPAFGTAQTGTGFGGTGGAFGTAGQNQGGAAFGGAFGNNQQAQPNKPFGTAFGATQATTATGGGGLFGNNNQQQQQQNTGGLFGAGDNKQFGPPAISTGAQGGGLFGNNATATGGTAGGLFGGGQATQASQGGLFGGGTGANAGSVGLFGNNANKPPGSQGGGLFTNTGPPSSTSGGLFGGSALGGSQLNTSTGGGFFNNQQQPQQQQQQIAGNGLFGSQFGNSLQGQQQQQQGFTASVMDSPYINPVLNSSLGNVPNSPMGPIATPLSSSVQTKKAAMIPHYKIAPRQPSLAPRLGNSFSRSGSPFAASSGSHATLGNSGSLGRSFSSTNKLHLFDGDDSILNSSSFTPNTSSRVASLKRLVIDKKIRDQDLFSGGQDLRKDNSGGSDFAAKGGTKSILKKTVSFDIAASRRGEEELYGAGPTSAKGKETIGPTPTAEEMGFLRSTPERRRLREVEETSNGSSMSDAPVVGNEVAIISEKPKDEKSPGTYWMVPNASKLKILPKEQQKRVMNLTIGRRGYGQVRFDNPVDISDIEDIDKIPGQIVLFAQRVCTVYPETMPKPPPGKGLNVPATITLEDCFPVSKNERGKIRDPEHPRYVTHIRRLKSIKDTEFVNYLASEGMWIFRVRHFTTYGLVESDDEEEDGDYTVDEPTMLPTGETPTPAKTPGSSLWDGDEESSMDADVSGVDNTSNYDDTFDFKKFGSSAIVSGSNRDKYSTFLGRSDRETSYEESEEEGDVTMDQSFLGEGSVGSAEDVDEPAEPVSDQSEEEVDTTVVDETDGDVTGALVLANSDMLSPVKEYEEEDTITQDSPAKPLPMGQDWTEQLNNTISPKKRRFGGESFMASTCKLANNPVKKFNIEPMSYGLLDLANDLYGGRASTINGTSTKGKGRATWDQVESPTSSRYQHENTWTATKNGESDAGTAGSDEKRWRNAIKPVWGKDGSIIYFGDLEGLERRRNYGNDLKLAKLKYSIQNSESHGAPKPLELQLRATAIKRDEFNVPVAELRMDTLFHSFAQLSWSPDDPAGQHEKSVWELASVLWDPIAGELALEEESQEMIEYMQETCRKERLSKFLEALVEAAADEHVHGATTLEEVAIAHLTAHRVEQACASLLEAGDFRLANLITMVGGDAKLRSSIEKQLEQWKNKGVLAEIPIPIRALYELLAGNTCYSEGVRGPPEDAAPNFFILDRFNLDWKRGFGLRLWYGCADEEPIGNAVVDYETDMREYPEAVPAPKPWYHTEASPARDDAIDILWGLLKLYADRELNLEEVLAPMNMTTSFIDYRLSWQLRTMLARKGIRDFSGGKLHRRIDGLDEFIAGSMADQTTIDFAGELETLGMWEWAIFVLLHLTDTDSRETAVRNVIGKHIDELKSAEGADVGRKLEFLEKTLLIPKNWICEARALQARSAGEHSLEAEYLLAAQAWNEAHKTVVKKVAPEAVISGHLEDLKSILAKFEDVDLVDKWNLGGQIYLDYIHLQEYVLSGKPHLKNAPEQKGLPKSNSPKDLARRLLAGLKNADRKGFLQNIAVREMAGVVGSWVLKSEDMISEAPKLLELPLTEDQFLRKTVNLGLAYYKARLQEAR
ncbi:nuclear protein 96-domain-containing protein [Tuber indicum]|nr:nuclear protein 96-domain-containing protein [Tuber indicum]